MQDGIKNSAGSIAPERKNSGSHFVKHDAEREQVRTTVQFLAQDLLGRHVGDGSQGGAGTGEMLWRGKRGAGVRHSRCRGGGIQLSQPEIENLGMAALGHKNVCWLDIAMDDAFGVRRVESVGNFDGNLKNAFQLYRTALDGVFEGHAIEEFHGDECFALLLTDVVDGADIRVIQCGGGLRFALETRQSLGILGNFVRQKFQSDEAMEARVFRFVDDSHSAAAQFFHNAVVG